MGKIRVFENAKRIGTFDVVCPSCGNVVASPYNGKSNRLSMKCPSCNFYLQEFSAIAVTHGDASDFSQRDIERRLRDYWERETHGPTKKQDFERAAEKIGIYDYSA